MSFHDFYQFHQFIGTQIGYGDVHILHRCSLTMTLSLSFFLSVHDVVHLTVSTMSSNPSTLNGAHSILNGVNGWSFDGVQSSGPISSIAMGLDHDYYTTPSAIVSSSQPPPSYGQIVENERKLDQERCGISAHSLAKHERTQSVPPDGLYSNCNGAHGSDRTQLGSLRQLDDTTSSMRSASRS